MNKCQLDVVKSKFIGVELLSWEDLFEGYDELYAITFSSGLQCMNDLLDRFSYAEVVFGCEEVVSELPPLVEVGDFLLSHQDLLEPKVFTHTSCEGPDCSRRMNSRGSQGCTLL